MTHRPLAQPLAADPEPWSVAAPDTERDAARPGRYRWVAAERVAPAPTSRVRACRRTDPCVTPPPGSDRMGDGRDRVAILPAPWAPVRGGGQ